MWFKNLFTPSNRPSIDDYAEILDIISDGMIVHFAVLDDDLNILAINEAWGKYGNERGIKLEYSWVGRSYIAPIIRSADAGDLDAQLAIIRLENLRAGKINSFSFVYPCNEEHKNRWFRCNARRSEKDGKNRFLICHIDITEEMESRLCLEAENQSLANEKQMVESIEHEMQFGLWSWSPEQQYLSLSTSAQSILHQSNVTWHDLEEGLSTEQRLVFLNRMEQTVQKKTSFEYQGEFVMKNGEGRILSFSGFYQEKSDQADGMICGVVRDISKEKETERRMNHLQKIEILGNLTAEISHDFNNSLSVIRGNTEMLREFADAKLLRFINRIERASNQASALTDKLTRFARSEQESIESVCAVQRLNEILEMAAKLLGDEVELCFSSSGKTAFIDVDPHEFDNAILNLMINARDAMPKGGRLSIDIDVQPAEFNRPGEVLITLEDSGSGIAQEQLDHVCEPFYSTKPSGKGTGLGLSVVSSFMERAKGHLQISSRLGEGTKVTLSFPLSQSSAQSLGHAEQQKRADLMVFQKTSVLVVEDEVEVRSMVVEALARIGMDVLEAQNSKEAKDIVASGVPIDLLFSDVVLGPNDLGPDLADWFLTQRPGTPILFTTGYADDALKDRGLDGLDSRILSKPYSLDTLLRAVKASLIRAPLLSEDTQALQAPGALNSAEAR